MCKTHKFNHGDLVRVAKDLGESMAHFKGDCNAIVIGSYADQFGGTDHDSYTLFIEGGGETSWYHECQLTFVRHAPELLETWKDQADARRLQVTNLRWIIENWEQIKKWPSCATMLKVMEIPTSFHRNGEFYCLMEDWREHFWLIDFIISNKPVTKKAPTPEFEKAMSELLKDRNRLWKKIEKEVGV